MRQKNEIRLTDHIEGLNELKVDLRNYEVSFRRWIISQLDGGHMSFTEIRDKFNLPRKGYYDVIKRWQERYSDELHLSLSFMSSQERADNKKLEQRIKDLEKQLEQAKMKNIALNTLIDVAETELKIPIRKKSGSKQ